MHDDIERYEYYLIVKPERRVILTDVDGWFEQFNRWVEWVRRPALSDLPDLANVDDVAHAIGCHVNTIYRACARGDILGATKIGGQWRIKSDVFASSFDSAA